MDPYTILAEAISSKHRSLLVTTTRSASSARTP